MISIIIPTKNEKKTISHTLSNLQILRKKKICEIILVDGRSDDETINISKPYVDKILSISPNRSRQQNLGVSIAEGEMLFEAVCAGYCHVKSGAYRDGKCPNLFDCEWKNGEGTDAEMFKVVSDGVPKTEMVGFAGQLPDDMLWQILAYVRSASQCKEETAGTAPGTASEKAAVSAHE